MSTNVDRAFSAFRHRGSDDDLVVLLDECRPVAIHLCLQFLAHREDAEDAAQHVLLEVARHASEMQNAACFRSWLYRVCLARSMDLRRRRSRRLNHEAKAARTEEENGHGSNGLAGESKQFLFSALAELSEEDRALVVEHYFEKSPLRVLADRRGCSKVAVWKRLGKIRDRLRSRLSQIGLAAILGHPAARLAEPVALPQRLPRAPRPAAETPGIGARAAYWTVAAAAGVVLFTAGRAMSGSTRPPRRDDPERPMTSRPFAGAPPGRVTEGVSGTPIEPVAFSMAPATVPAAAPDPEALPASFRDLVRLLFRHIQDQRRSGTRISPELAIELSPINDEARLAHRDPAGRAGRFARYAVLLYEVAGEENGVAFTPEDKISVERLKEEYAAALKRVPDGSGPAKLLAAVEADLAFARGMSELLPDDEAGRTMFSDIDRILKRGKRKSMPRERILREIVADWSAAIRPDAGVATVLGQAAERLSSSLARITEEFRGRAGDSYDEDPYMKNVLDRAPVSPYDPVRRMEYQVANLRALVEALALVRPALDSTQTSRLMTAEPWNYAVSRQGMLIENRD